VSKLRQIMLHVDEQPAQADKLLVWVEKMHRELSRETHVKSLFVAMVAREGTGEREQATQTEVCVRRCM